jgi:translation elongation factor P/translation initiation factor 5A
MVIASELKPGMFLRIEGEIYKVLEAESKAGSAKLGGVVKTKLCNVTSGRMWDRTFGYRSGWKSWKWSGA